MRTFLKAIRTLFGGNEVEEALKFVAFRKISHTQVTVPDGHIWITRRITVDAKETHSWFLLHPFNSMYRFGSASRISNVVYLRWPGEKEKGKVKKASSPNISKNITIKPVWFESGMTISTSNDRVVLEVIDLSVQS